MPITRSRAARCAAVAITAVIGILLVAAAIFFSGGGRWYVVSTPSMGEAAPVGTLVLAAPTPFAGIRVGDIITFHPPTSPGETFTHLVVGFDDAGLLLTKGDANGAIDPWSLGAGDLIGRTVSVLPGVGWLIRAFPLLLVGASALTFGTRFIRSRPLRSATRVLGASVLLSVVIAILRPLSGFTVMATRAISGQVEAVIVSTGLLPIRLETPTGTATRLSDGQVGSLLFSGTPDSDGGYTISSFLNLSLLGWVTLAVICALPLAWTTLVGLPEEAPR